MNPTDLIDVTTDRAGNWLTADTADGCQYHHTQHADKLAALRERYEREGQAEEPCFSVFIGGSATHIASN